MKYHINGTVTRPAAVFYGDVVVRGGQILYDPVQTPATASTLSALAVAPPPPAHDHGAKDVFAIGTGGLCGYGFGAGAGHILLMACANCTEAQFEAQRHTCCGRPRACISPTNATCHGLGTAALASACEEAGCQSLAQPTSTGTPPHTTRCIARETTNTWTARLEPDPDTPAMAALRRKSRRLASRADTDRPSYHVGPDKTIDLVGGGLVRLYDADTGLPYVYAPDPTNPETMGFATTAPAGSTEASGDVNLTLFDDPTPVTEATGTQMARVEVTTWWDASKHFDLRIKPSGTNNELEFVYETESKIPYEVLLPGVIRGTGLVRLHNRNVTIVPASVKSKLPTATTRNSEPDDCDAIAETHAACFADPTTTPYAECLAMLHSVAASQCCGHLFEKNIYVDCFAS